MFIFIMATRSILTPYSPRHPANSNTTGLGCHWIDCPVIARSAAAAGSGVAIVGIEPPGHQSRRPPFVAARLSPPSATPPARGIHPCTHCAFSGLGTVMTVVNPLGHRSRPSRSRSPSIHLLVLLPFTPPLYPPLTMGIKLVPPVLVSASLVDV